MTFAALGRVAVAVAITLAVPLYLFELYLWVAAPAPFSKAEATLALRARGVAAYPSVFPSGFIDLSRAVGGASPITVDGAPVLPLAGIPEVPTVYCRGVVYDSDGLGFRNGERDGPAKIALLGDSFVQGFCVPDEGTYAAHLGQPGTVASFGMNGTSMLAQAAIYREFVAVERPRNLVWFFYAGNDLLDFSEESGFTLLHAYLDPDHSQELRARGAEVAAAMRRYVDAGLASDAVGQVIHDAARRPGLAARFRAFATLRLTRRAFPALFGPAVVPHGLAGLSETDWETIAAIWGDVVGRQRAHGGKTTFVYLPDHRRLGRAEIAPFAALEARIAGIWTDLGAAHVSLTAMLAGLDDPRALYDGLHFGPEGYARTADFIRAGISR